MLFSPDGSMVQMRPGGAWHNLDGSSTIEVTRFTDSNRPRAKKGDGTPTRSSRKGERMRGRGRRSRRSN